ncbi:MAG: DUF4011 domain-containing protein [Bacteroidetes bacterium]|nr:MAG: DUF4011 domain-containing protein [Bacteroidota bacterium]
MSVSHTYQLDDFISDLTRVSFTDPLIHLPEDSRSCVVLDHVSQDLNEIELAFSGRLHQVYKIALQLKRQSDVHSLCLAPKLIEWEFRQKHIQSPLFLVPVRAKKNKVKQSYSFSLQWEEAIINPFLINILKKEYQLDYLPDPQLSLADQEDDFIAFLKRHDFQINIISAPKLGNFHHHRFEILRDLELISQKENPGRLINLLLGSPNETEVVPPLELVPDKCFYSDSDQEQIFSLFQDKDLVVQGPPGTGKSQTLANLLAKLLFSNKPHLFVSEKKTALDVLVQKLRSVDLHHLLFLSHSQQSNSEFIRHLKSSWTFFEQHDAPSQNHLSLSQSLEQHLQLRFERLRNVKLLQYYPLHDLQSFAQSKTYQNISFVSQVPEIDSWQEIREKLTPLFEHGNTISQLCSLVPQSSLQYFDHLDEQVEQLRTQHHKICSELNIVNLQDLESAMKKAARVHLLEVESGKKYFDLFNDKSKLKRFQNLRKKYLHAQESFKLLDEEKKRWKKTPSATELQSWKIQLQHKNWFVRKRIEKQIKALYRGENILAQKALDHLEHCLEQERDFIELRQKLRSIGVEDPDTELSLVSYVLEKINSWESNELNDIMELSEGEKNKLIQLSLSLGQFHKKLSRTLQLNEQESISQQLNFISENFANLWKHRELLKELSPESYKLFSKSKDQEQMEQIVLKSHWVQFSSLYPELAEFNGKQLYQSLDKIISSQEKEQGDFAAKIIQQTATRFRYFEQLLLTPARQLSEKEKELKKRLRSGKAILVKEFAKSRQHRSIRELMASEAQEWIRLICPVFLCTPVTVSRNFELEADLFECLIVDEASQLALPKIISSLFRSQRLLVAGDSQQMAPSSYFGGAYESVDLLHQARFYLKQSPLRHHYRSKHNALISFSNRHFYDNELLVFPEAPNSSGKEARTLHYVPRGIYENRMNVGEAKRLSEELEKIIHQPESIGIVAFSEQQLKCIQDQVPSEIWTAFEQKTERDGSFFKALEQVQGEECDILLISLGYAKDPAGKFHLRFGPINQEHGSKRLNVLLTRAIREIHFFCSVRSEDFRISNNDGVNLLRRYIQALEQQEVQREEDAFLPFGIPVSGRNSGGELEIMQPQLLFPDGSELITFHRVMKERKWKLSYKI